MMLITTLATLSAPAYASFGGQVKNIRIRGGGGSYRMEVVVDSEATDAVDNVEVTVDGSTLFVLEPEQSSRRARTTARFTQAPADDALFTVVLNLTDGASTVGRCFGTVSMAEGDSSLACAMSSGESARAELQVWSTLSGTERALSFDLQGAATSAVGATLSVRGAGLDRTVVTTEAVALDSLVSTTFSTEVTVSGDPVGFSYAVDVEALDAEGGRVDRMTGDLQIMRVEGSCGGGLILGVYANGKGTNQAASNASGKAGLL